MRLIRSLWAGFVANHASSCRKPCGALHEGLNHFIPHRQILKSPAVRGFLVSGGEGGIRTLDTLLTYTHFPGVRLQPLGHLTGTWIKNTPRGRFLKARRLPEACRASNGKSSHAGDLLSNHNTLAIYCA